ncbi:MAG TPA: DEAD/DEAH box helicase [Pedococcus sp.]|nr:DEAD/DEAH box helicase [Pedococcus sp.]
MPKNLRSDAPKKARWTPDKKAAAKKGPKKPHRGQAGTSAPRGDSTPYAARPARDGERPARREFSRDERPARREFNRDERPARREFSRDERPARREFNRDERPARREFSRDERPARREFSRDERPARREFSRDERPARREFSRDERPARREFSRDERPARREFNRDDSRGSARFERTNRFDRSRSEDQVDPETERMAADTWVKATRKSVDGPVTVESDNGFAQLGLADRIVERLARDGITTPFPIQTATIPDALAGKDVLGRGQTGSGKTLAFGLPLLTRLAEGGKSAPRRPRALIMVPTRELAMQVSDALEPLVHVLGLRHKLVAGGLSYTTQINALNRGVDLLIATPGRLKDLVDREAVQLGDIEITVLDEADHMADMGFLPEVTAILDQMPTGGQRMMFSATLDKGIDQLVARYLTDPVTHSTNDAKASVTTMEHHVLLIDPMHKKTITAEVANRAGRTVVFVRTKLGADRVALQLREQGVFAAALHGGLAQGARNRVLGAFRDGTLPVLVATDVAARGIHVDDVSVVLQVDPPADHKDYLHRSGRTARAGDKGTVVTLALPHQRRTMERMAREAGIDALPTKAIPGDDRLAATGASSPSGIPVPEDQVRRVLEGEKRGGRRPGGPSGPRGGGPRGGGPRGPRQGGRSFGGDRPDRGYSRGSRD